MDDNQTSLSYRLSDDILFIIFQLVESFPTNTLQPVETKAPFNISLVSKHWRQLALDMPLLWTRIDPINVHMIPTLIERSKGSPLIIEFVSQDWEYSIRLVTNYPTYVFARHAQLLNFPIRHLCRYLEKVLPYIDRWKSFKIESSSDANFENLCPLAPELQVACGCQHSCNDPIPLSVSLFQDHTPRLRVLDLCGACLPLSSPIYTGLEWLNLDPIGHESLSQLIRIIASCPLLKFLRITSYFSFVSETQQPPMPVDLPHLQCLLINHDEWSIIHILSSFLFPALLKLGLEFWVDIYDRGLTYMGSDVVERLPILTRIRSARVTINHDAYASSLTLTGRDDFWNKTDVDIFNIVYGTLEPVEEAEMVLPECGKKFPFPALEELYFEGFLSVIETQDPLLFVRTLLNFPTITCLALSMCPSSFLKALLIDSESLLHPCPLLERLVIFDPHRDLVRIVKSRLENPRHVTPLRHLTIMGFHLVDEETMSALRDLPFAVEVKDSDGMDHLRLGR